MVKNQPANARDTDSIPGSGRSPGVGNGSPLQYSCLKNSVDTGAWQATVHGAGLDWSNPSVDGLDQENKPGLQFCSNSKNPPT